MPSGFRFAILALFSLLVGVASAHAQDEFNAGSADMNTSPDVALRCAQLLSRNFENPDYQLPPECRANVRSIEDQARDLQRQYVQDDAYGNDEDFDGANIRTSSDVAFRCAQLLSRNFERPGYQLPPECGSARAQEEGGSADMNRSPDLAFRCAQLLSRNFENPDYQLPPECRANDRKIENQARDPRRR